jgi:hypothetical protein
MASCDLYNIRLNNASGDSRVLSAANAPNLRPAPMGRVRPQLESAVGIGNDIIAHLADGGSWRTSITLVNLSQTKAATYMLKFYGDSGVPQSFSFEGIGNSATLTGTISAGGSSTGTNTVTTQGWAQCDHFNTTDSIGGFAVFTNSNWR